MPKQNHTNWLRILRICVAAVSFAAIVLLLLNIGNHFDEYIGWVAKLQLWPAVMAVNVATLVLMTALTMLFGRVYCSFICPLGIMQDIIYRVRITGKKKRRFMQNYSPAKNIMRYVILAVFILAVCIEDSAIAYMIEPYSIFGRMVTSFAGKSLVIGGISLVTFLIIAVLVWKYGRTWCNTICPVGSILGILSRASLFKVSIDKDKCVNCGLCAKGCRASCIDFENHSVDSSRCIECFDCIDNCNTSAISFKFGIKAAQKEAQEVPAADKGRRAFITATALAAGSVALKAQDNHGHGVLAPLAERKAPERETAVVPAGSASLNNFNQHCVACQLCVNACSNHVLNPDMSLGRFMMPKMDFEKGWCRPECNDCSTVCPAGAIIKVTPEEKTAISIGHAVYNPDLCVVKTDGVECGNCAHHCPAGAISMVKSAELDGRRIPAVNPERCIGCGRCEYVCPSRPVSAIHIEGNLLHRSI